MNSKLRKPALMIAAIILAAGLVMGLIMGPNGTDDLGSSKIVTIDMGGGFIDADVSRAFSQAGVGKAHVAKASTDGAEPTLAIVRLPSNVRSLPGSVVSALRESYPSAAAGELESIEGAANLGHWALKGTLAGVCFLVLIFVYGWLRYRLGGALNLSISVLLDVALTLAIGILCRIPLSHAFLGALGLTAAYSLAIHGGWQNAMAPLRKEHGNWSAERLLEAVKAETKGRGMVTLLLSLVLIAALFVAGQGTLMNGACILAAIGVLVSTLMHVALSEYWWQRFQRA